MSASGPIARAKWLLAPLLFWQDSDETGSWGVVTRSALIAPEARFVLASGGGVDGLVVVAGWPRLNDSGDTVELLDAAGGAVDRLVYVDASRGRSLKRIDARGEANDPTNWLAATSSGGVTPGTENSVSFVEAETPLISATPNPFSDQTRIEVVLPFRRSRLVVRGFDRLGRPVQTLVTGAEAGSDTGVTWDGRESQGM